jgi:hypothetical protein
MERSIEIIGGKKMVRTEVPFEGSRQHFWQMFRVHMPHR